AGGRQIITAHLDVVWLDEDGGAIGIGVEVNEESSLWVGRGTIANRVERVETMVRVPANCIAPDHNEFAVTLEGGKLSVAKDAEPVRGGAGRGQAGLVTVPINIPIAIANNLLELDRGIGNPGEHRRLQGERSAARSHDPTNQGQPE